MKMKKRKYLHVFWVLLVPIALLILPLILLHSFFFYRHLWQWYKGDICIDQLQSLFVDLRAAFQIVSALVTSAGLYAAYRYWRGERILELESEYDKLAGTRKIFWDKIDRAYRTIGFESNNLESSSPTPAVDHLIRNADEVYPPSFIPDKIGDKPGDDLLAKVHELDQTLKKCLYKNTNIGKLWKLARFIYPSREDLTEDYFSYKHARFKKKHIESFDRSRGRLARFWNKWGSKRYSRKELLKNYLGAHEQLIMLTWLELALVRQVNDYGRGKIHLLKLAKEVDKKMRKRRLSFREKFLVYLRPKHHNIL